MDYKKIGHFLNELRKEKNWTQDDLAQELIVDRGTISKWERGVYIPTPEMLLRLQEVFNITVNEILYGERKNENNNNEINSVPVKIIKESQKKIKKILISSAMVIILLSLFFLAYYFFSTYNSITAYRIYGGEDEYYIHDGIMLVSKEKCYIKLGALNNNTNDEIESIRLYYKKKNKQYTIFIGSVENTNDLLTNRFNYNELFKYSDLKFIKNSLTLELNFKNNTKRNIKLVLKKDFANDNIFNGDVTIPISSNEKNMIPSEYIPKYVKENFNYNNNDKKYYMQSQNILEEYFVDLHMYLITIYNSEVEEHFEYDCNEHNLSYYKIIKSEILDNFSYNYNEKNCNYGKCNKKIVEDFKGKYITKID